MDLFLPQSTPKGLLVFVHGGYWKAFDKSVWSHMANGALARGLAVSMPSYRLCPEVRIPEIVADVGEAVTHAAGLVEGPIFLAGHSAGGHLASRMLAQPSPLDQATLSRVSRCLSISGLHDLRPLMHAEMNDILKIDNAEAQAHSPALLYPVEGVELVAWVGSAERAEFLRQNALLPMMWSGLGAKVAAHVEPDRHHFDVIDGMLDGNGDMLGALVGARWPLE
jgi:acetyl esterase/lipase